MPQYCEGERKQDRSHRFFKQLSLGDFNTGNCVDSCHAISVVFDEDYAGNRKDNRHMDAVEQYIRPLVDPADWTDPEPGDDRYGTNQMVGAFNAGRVFGMENAVADMQGWMNRTLVENVAKAAQHTHILLEWLNARDIHPVAARLKDERFNAPEVMFIIPVAEFVGSQFNGVYGYVGARENEWREPSYSITFSFCWNGPTLDMDLIEADGFDRRYRALER